MDFSKESGAVDLPIIIVLSVILTSISVAVGIEGMNRAKRLKGKQEAIKSFNKLIETAKELSYGRIGNEEKIRLETESGKIIVNRKLIQLSNGETILRAEKLPLSLLRNGKKDYVIQNGSFSIILKSRSSSKKQNFLDLRRTD